MGKALDAEASKGDKVQPADLRLRRPVHQAATRTQPHRPRRRRIKGQKRASDRRHYNYFRDYEPGTGRYVESDPIGFKGGIATYAYAANDAISATDMFGLSPSAGCSVVAVIPGFVQRDLVGSKFLRRLKTLLGWEVQPTISPFKSWRVWKGSKLIPGYQVRCTGWISQQFEDTYRLWRENTLVELCVDFGCERQAWMQTRSETQELGKETEIRNEAHSIGAYFDIPAPSWGQSKCQDWLDGL